MVGIGQLYFKILAIRFYTEKNQKINNKLKKLTNSILQEKNNNQIKQTLKTGKTK